MKRQRSDAAATIDVARWIDKIEECLKTSQDRGELLDGLAILQRWQFDDMIDDSSRERARLLVRRFAPWPMFGQSS
ncbi:MAG TPA: hypothetical protein VEB21_07215 [Terriglobales bacterium]|nr:hypothetical protein [Terriglobales bacterium]